MLLIREQLVGRWLVPGVVFQPEDLNLAIAASSIIGNSVWSSKSGKARLTEWKRIVAAAAKDARGPAPLNPRWSYSVSAGLSFNVEAHGNQPLDVENFLKPTFDALAAGLFCTTEQDPRAITRYNFDDSKFQYLFVHRLADALTIEEEGAGLIVSVRKAAQEQRMNTE